MTDPLAQFLFILLAWVLISLVKFRYCAELLAVMGAVFVFIYSPAAMLLILLTVLEGCLLVRLLSPLPRSNPWRKYLGYLLLANLFFVDFHQLLLGFSIGILAISFSTVRIFMTARDILSERKPKPGGRYKWIPVAAFYLPAVVIGPVFSGLILRDQDESGKKPESTLKNHRLLLQGLVLSTMVAAYFSTIAQQPLFNETVPLRALVLFLLLFSSFWGQSLIAEQSSIFFGYKLPQNFDEPWKARSIKDFWARWHRSMANFVMQYIYLPLQLRGVPAKLATVLAFVFMGLWHNVSPGYLLWGIVHGLCLSFWPETRADGWKRWLFDWGSILATWVIVIGMSYLANYSGLSSNG
jgi:D-alanyl-lipoteichoic acid acyltransferase DltB (MBOAT superfamily)